MDAILEILTRVFGLNTVGTVFSGKRNGTLVVSSRKPIEYVRWLSKVIAHPGEKVFSWPDIQWSESINSRDQGIYVILESDRI